jgi:Tfp pilus assembly PilM family ATPase
MSLRRIAPTRLSPIGLDIGTHEIRAVQLARGGSGDSLVCRAVFPRHVDPSDYQPMERDEAAWMAGVLARKGFVGDRVAVIAPHGSCSAHIVELPARESGAPKDVIARAEIARTRKCPPDRFELATWYLPQRGRTDRGMAIACEKPQLESCLDALEGAGLVPVAVDLEETAFARACAPALSADPDAIHAMLRIGWNSTMGVLSLGETVVYTRRFEVGVGRFVCRFKDRTGLSWNDASRVLDTNSPDAEEPDAFEEVARSMWADLAETLGAEIDTAVTYVTHAHRSAPIGRVLVSGYGGGRAEVLSTLDEILGMPVSPADCWPGADAVGDAGECARYAVAAGLAGRFDA